jgi:hypothetical protein
MEKDPVDQVAKKFGYDIFKMEATCRICGCKFGGHMGLECPRRPNKDNETMAVEDSVTK